MKMTEFERELRKQGFSVLAGIDEVGRGPLAGPVVTSAVILPESFYLPGLNDSKKIPESKRELFYETILKEAYPSGWALYIAKKLMKSIYIKLRKRP